MTLKRYNDNELILDLIEARLGKSEIAAKHGITLHMLGNLQAGRVRPAFKARLDRARRAAKEEMILLGATDLREVFDTQMDVALHGTATQACKARHYILDLSVPGDAWRLEEQPGQKRPAARKAARARPGRGNYAALSFDL